jgi:hypothetical protein
MARLPTASSFRSGNHREKASGQRDPRHSHQSIEPVLGKENAGPR